MPRAQAWPRNGLSAPGVVHFSHSTLEGLKHSMTSRTSLCLSAAVLLLMAPAAWAAEPAAKPPPVIASATAGEGHDFAAQAKLLFRAVACGSDDPLPEGLDRAVVEAHCRALAPKILSYRARYVGEARTFLAKLRPTGLPSTVVYPFGGGDLLSALTTYPDASDITTLSLEHAGDPRRLDKIGAARLAESLDLFRRSVWGLLMADNSTTENMQALERGEIPGQLAFFLVGLAVQGFEPVSLRYFSLNPDGSLHYLSLEEIAAQEKILARTLRGVWKSPDVSIAFSNAELTFRPKGGGPLRVHRHFAADISDRRLSKDAAILKYLEGKGRVAAMTKAASYVLWRKDFDLIRRFLLGHMEFMISDSTGIPPRYVEGTGFSYETYGTFNGSFLGADEESNAALRKVWKAQPARLLPFRYGYPDSSGKWHLFLLRKADAAKAKR